MTGRRVGSLHSGAVAVATSLLVVSGCGESRFTVPSEAMAPLLHTGDTITAKDVSSYRPRRGDVVVFKEPSSWVEPGEEAGLRIYRVIAIAGDRVMCCTAGGAQTIDGTPIEEPYLAPGTEPSNIRFDETVPPGHLWLEGDNRPQSADSRVYNHGTDDPFVPVSNVVAVVVDD